MKRYDRNPIEKREAQNFMKVTNFKYILEHFSNKQKKVCERKH
jgi:hypothetical protein